MDTELTVYRNNKIAEQIRIYNENSARLYSAFTANIRNVQQSRVSTKLKQTRINNFTVQYNYNLSVLKSAFAANIQAIQRYQPASIRITNKKNALLVGINYTGTSNELFGCVNDALAIQERLTAASFNRITSLLDTRATRKNILREFQSLLSNSNPGDLLFFLYSGHGSYAVDTNGDEQPGYDQLIVPSDFATICDDELKSLIQKYLKPNTTLFAMFDSCFSGSVLDLKYQYMDSLNYDKYTENSCQLDTPGNVFMISGCSDIQTSADAFIINKANGAMTWALLESLQHKSPVTVTWRELVKHMRNLLRTSNYDQIPQFSCGKFENIDSTVFI